MIDALEVKVFQMEMTKKIKTSEQMRNKFVSHVPNGVVFLFFHSTYNNIHK